jgi:hypothetical protein
MHGELLPTVPGEVRKVWGGVWGGVRKVWGEVRKVWGGVRKVRGG